MNDRNNKTSICSIVFLDIIDYSKKTDSEQIEIKNQFNALINHALKDVAENDRIILDTGDGAAIASNGSPEDILFIALNIRDEIIENNIHSVTPLYVRFGVNLGPVRVVKDINGRPNIIGDGINVAQRIMSFAKPNQILVSRSYYEVTSRLTQEISQMFDYSGIKQDKHVREHEVYSVRLLKEQTVDEGVVGISVEDLSTTPIAASKKINWKYAALAAPALLAFFLIIKSASEPIAPKITLDPAVAAQSGVPMAGTIKTPSKSVVALSEIANTKNTSNNALMPNETIESMPQSTTLATAKADIKNDPKNEIALQNKAPDELLEIELAKKKAKQKAKKKAEEATLQTSTEAKPQHGTVRNQEVIAAKIEVKKESAQEKSSHEKSNWNTFKDSVKKGGEVKCSQAQIAMHQCS